MYKVVKADVTNFEPHEIIPDLEFVGIWWGYAYGEWRRRGWRIDFAHLGFNGDSQQHMFDMRYRNDEAKMMRVLVSYEVN